MSQYRRSRGRVAFGIFAIILGTLSLVSLPVTSSYYGIGAFGPAGYGAIMFAVGVALLAKKEPVND
jgi:predicted phage tail protein